MPAPLWSGHSHFTSEFSLFRRRFLIELSVESLLLEEQKLIDFARQFEQPLRILLVGRKLTQILPTFLVFSHDEFLAEPNR